MKHTLGVCLLVLASASVVVAQNPTKPMLRRGIRVEMAKASHAVEMPEADAENATVLTITRDGELFLGTSPTETTALSNLKTGTVYLKVDAGAPFQNVLTVLDTFRNRTVVLLTQAVSRPENGKFTPPYGVKVSLGE